MASPCCGCGRDLDKPGPQGLLPNRVDLGDGRVACKVCEPKVSKKRMVQMRSYSGKVETRERR